MKRLKQNGATATGWPRLAQHIGKDVVDKLTEWLDVPDTSEPPKPPPARASVTVVPVPAYQPFPLNAFPEGFRSFVGYSANAIGCDPSFVASPLLAALASAIGNTRRI